MSSASPSMSAIKLALLAQQLRADSDGFKYPQAEPIAIVGVGCRFPGGANSPDEFWQLLAHGVDAIREVPSDRWDIDAYYDPSNAPGKMTSRYGGFLDRPIDRFDAAFFGLSPREAAQMDPQQRLLLEVAVEALDDAGQTRDGLSGSSTGVFIASYHNDYSYRLVADPIDIDAYTSTGTAHSIVANRLSYWLNLQGPSMAIDTACSSSLVAVHLACQSLRSGECHLALAGGVSLMLSPEVTLSLSKWGFLAADGRCKTFDARADGFVRGEGCGVIVLKRLSDALGDGDRILALVRGSAVNQDGRSTVLTAPNGLAQQEVIRQALTNASVTPDQITYIEAHGTGTLLGDPIEVEALTEVYGQSRAAGDVCALASVKTNIGHLEAAAGVAGLIKVVLCLQHDAIPPHLHFRQLNPHLRLAGTPFVIPTATHAWPGGGQRRLAGVSSFGFGGTNAHVMLEEAPVLPHAATPEDRPFLLPLSAQTDDALDDLAAAYRDFLSRTQADVRDIAYTASVHRTHYDRRAAVVGRSRADWIERLAQVADRSDSVTSIGKIAFVFSGQGPQWWAMGRELLEHEPVFRAMIERCAELLQPYAAWSLLTELMRPEAESRLDQTEIAQPAIFAVQVALAEVWRAWGITPSAVTGHSVGEIAAAYMAGVLSLEEAVRVVYHRGRLMQHATGLGKMAAVELSATEAARLIAEQGVADRLSIAAINSPTSITLSGEAAALEQVMPNLQQRGIVCRVLRVNYAFHSPQMEPFQAELARTLQGLQPRSVAIPIVSTVTGAHAIETDYDAAYWGRNIRQPVQFARAIQALIDQGCTTWIEIGPHPALATSIVQCLEERQAPGQVLASLRRGQAEQVALLQSLGELYVKGYAINWESLYPDGQCVSLPAYPWQRERYWFEPTRHSRHSTEHKSVVHPLLGRRVRAASITDVIFEAELGADDPAFLADHVIAGSTVVLGTAYLEMALAAAHHTGRKVVALEDVALEEALIIPDDGSRIVQTVVQPETDSFKVFSLAGEDTWKLHASGRWSVAGTTATPNSLIEVRARCAIEIEASAYYQRLRERGIEFGPRFQGVAQLWRNATSDEALACVKTPPALLDELAAYRQHPAFLDACLQVVNAAFMADRSDEAIYLPVAIDRLRFYQPLSEEVWSHAKIERRGDMAVCEVRVSDASGQVLLDVTGLRLKRTVRAALSSAATDVSKWLYELAWRPQPLAARAHAIEGACLIVAGEGALGHELAQLLTEQGAICQLISPAALRETLAHSPALRGVVQVCDSDRALLDALHLVQALAAQTAPPQVWMITIGGQAVVTDEVAASRAALWGLARTIMLEQPELRCACIDLDPASLPTANARSLLAELTAVDAENQIAYRNDQRYVARLARHVERRSSHIDSSVHLTTDGSGLLDRLTLQSITRRAPGAGEIEIRVQASGLNFRDVLNALGMYPGEAGPLGSECAGVISAVGDGVDRFHVGHAVLAIARDTFSTYAVTRAEFAVPKPIGLSYAAAATLPIAFLTAMVGLQHLAQLKAGERVLIHAAAGGVGLAAVQIAQRAGTEVFGTAGSSEKRAFLQSIGVQHVLDSRTLDFAEEIKRLTKGDGVDVVLNALSGDFIEQSVSVLKPNGRFLEIGKRDVWAPDRMTQARPDAAYFIYDLGDVMRDSPALIQALLCELLQALQTGELKPLPIREFPLDEASEAFRFMERAKHIGKIAVTQAVDRAEPIVIRGDATYLITGGLGGLGLQAARWLVEQGARQIMLMGRTAPSSAAQAEIDQLEQHGAHVIVAQADVSQADQIAAALAKIDPATPLCGVIHAAGALADGVLVQQTDDRFVAVLAAKQAGAWNLHKLTQDQPLDFFVMFSSIASVLGSVGQGNYAAANAYLDALAHTRRAQGLPALSIDWGPWSEVGMAAALSAHDQDRRRAQGLGFLTPAQGTQALAQTLQQDVAQLLVLPIDWRRYVGSNAVPPLLREVAQAAPIEKARAAAFTIDVAQQVFAAAPNQRRSIVQQHVRAHATKVLGLGAAHTIDPRRPLSELGLDSLMAVELRNALGVSLKRLLPATLLFDYPTLETLTDFLLKELSLSEPPIVSAPSKEDRAITAGVELAQLSEAEAEALLLAELSAGKPRRSS
jgi:acyl transferase domain-containing protein/NADPH:quinone reductase-like Zn-dependent oxidoreductase/nucleoside-diphosphate-sugar epimerase/acyl carrier protein